MLLNTNRNGLIPSFNELRCFMILRLLGGMTELVVVEWCGDDGQGIRTLSLRNCMLLRVSGCTKLLERTGCLRMRLEGGSG